MGTYVYRSMRCLWAMSFGGGSKSRSRSSLSSASPGAADRYSSKLLCVTPTTETAINSQVELLLIL